MFSMSSSLYKFQLEKDVPYLGDGRTEKLDLYLPVAEGAKPLRGGVVWIHGGGWYAGRKTDAREVSLSTDLAGQGFVVASIDYLLAGAEQPSWPQALYDCKNAVRFLRANAQKFRIAPRNIAVGGGSAGAHLALMVGYTNDLPEWEPPASPHPHTSSRVEAVLNFYGVTNLLTWHPTNPDGTPFLFAGCEVPALFTGVSRETGAPTWQAASPITHVRRDLPPTFIAHGKMDREVTHHQSLELAEALRRAGAAYQMEVLENAGHTFTLTHWADQPLEKDLTPLVVGFLNNCFPVAATA